MGLGSKKFTTKLSFFIESIKHIDMITTITYSLYIILSALLIIYVGNVCYNSGLIFVGALFPKEQEFSKSINRTLKVAYYCMNIGYVFYSLNQPYNIITIGFAVDIVVSRLGEIMLLIGCMHLVNTLSILIYYKLKNKKHHARQH